MVHEYTDRIGGAKAKRPALDQMMAAAYRREFDTDLNLISEIRTRALALKRQGRSPDDDGKQVRTSKRSIPTGATPTPLDSSNAPMRNFNRTG
jgi:hypothetical protein